MKQPSKQNSGLKLYEDLFADYYVKFPNWKHLDLDTPKQIEKRINQCFQKTIQSHKFASSGRYRHHYELTEPWKSRRMKAIPVFVPEVRKRFATKYPDLDVVSSYLTINTSFLPSYGYNDVFYGTVFGAAIWILDRLKENQHLDQAQSLFPSSSEEVEDLRFPPLTDLSFDEHTLLGMFAVLTNRNRDGYKKDHIEDDEEFPRYLCDHYSGVKKPPMTKSRERYLSVLKLVDEESIQTAVRHFEQKQWEWLDLYFAAEQRHSVKFNKIIRNTYQNVSAMLDIMQKSIPLSDSSLRILNDAPSISFNSEFNRINSPFHDETSNVSQLSSCAVQLQEFSHRIIDFQEDAAFCFRDSHQSLTERYGKQSADAFCQFSIADPFEICFAALYLLDSHSDLPWNYAAGLAVTNLAGMELPWNAYQYEKQIDRLLTADPAIAEEVLHPSEGDQMDWYRLCLPAKVLFGSDVVLSEEDLPFPERINAAQVLNLLTNTLPPRTTYEQPKLRKKLSQCGFSKEKVDQFFLVSSIAENAEALQEACGQNSRMQALEEARISFLDDLKTALEEEDESLDYEEICEPDEDFLDDEPEISEAELFETIANLRAELRNAKDQNRSLRATVAQERRNAKAASEEKEAILSEMQEEKQELADLRQLVFNREEGESSDRVSSKVNFPYEPKKKIFILGGHATWLKEIRPLLPTVRFGEDNIPTTEALCNYDVLWIQSNCLSHTAFYKATDVARNNKISIRYFGFASARKCAEQLALDDMS